MPSIIPELLRDVNAAILINFAAYAILSRELFFDILLINSP